jgi:hypothetical protein
VIAQTEKAAKGKKAKLFLSTPRMHMAGAELLLCSFLTSALEGE